MPRARAAADSLFSCAIVYHGGLDALRAPASSFPLDDAAYALAALREVPSVMSDEDGKVAGAPEPASDPPIGAPEAAPARDAQPPEEPAAAPPSAPAAPPPSRSGRTSNGTVMMAGSRESRSSATGGASASRPASTGPARTSQGTVLMAAEPQRRTRTSRTTIMEVSQVAQRLSLVGKSAAPGEPSPTRQIAMSFAVSVTVVMLLTMMFAGGALRLVLGVIAATSGTTLVVWLMLRALPRLAKRLGQRELPGTPLLWVGGLVAIAMATTAGLTWGVSEATRSLARPILPEVPVAAPEPTAAPSDPAKSARADEGMKRGAHVSMPDGVLYVPPAFQSEDGRFDVVIHYHGNPEIVERSIDAAGLNAIAHIINLGDGSGRYSEPLSNPQAFDNALERIEQRVQEKFGLRAARIRRVALSSWSAGFGAVYHILTSRSRLDRVDALLMMDSLHASFAPGSETKVTDLSLRPFVQFARRAMAGEKLMVLTHSSIETYGYPNTTQSADGLLERLGLKRREASPDKASPPPVDLDVIVKAFPPDERNWMRVTSDTEEGSLVVLGCRGKGKGDHIAHLAQMSVAVLPRLVQRWKSSGAPE